MTKTFTPSPDKLYYSIGEVAEIIGVATSVLRFWEKSVPEISPRKNKRGQRQYTADDVQEFILLHHLVKTEGRTLEAAREKLRRDRTAVKHKQEQIERLIKVKEFLLELKSHL